jgi:hypothetical protein
MIVEPEKAFILGGTYRVPVLAGMLNKDFVSDLKREGTFDEASFDREYKRLYSINFVNCWKALRVA